MTAIHEDTTIREATGTDLAPLPPGSHLLQPIMRWAKDAPDRPIVSFRRNDEFVDVSAADFYGRIRALAKGFIASGVEPGDRVVLMSRTRLEWLVIDYAVLAAGGVTVPVFETSSSEQLEWILSDSGAVLAFVETPAMRTSYEEVHAHATMCRDAFVIDEGGIEEMTDRGHDIDDAVLDARIASIAADRIATIVYTSGTTGRPKGCIQTHGNLCTNVAQNIGAVRSMLTDDETTLVFLPLAHTLTKAIALVCMEWGVKLAFATGLPQLQEELALVRPTLVVAVPRVFEKVFNGAQHKATAEGHGKVFEQGRGGGHPLVGGSYGGALPAGHRSRARRAGPLGLPEAPGCVRWAPAVRVQRWWAAGRTTHALLQRDRREDLRGVRPHRDEPDPDHQQRRGLEARDGRSTARGYHDPDRERRRDPRQGTPGVRRLLERRGGDGRGLRRRWVVPHR